MKGTVLGIAGIGLIGGSIALRARLAGATVIGYDRDAGALRAATAASALDDVAPDLASLAARSTVVAIALPVDATVEAVAHTPELAVPELVFDVASVKAPVVRAASALARFVPSHPLAGREVGGFRSADAVLFEGRSWAIVPARDPVAQERLAGIVRLLGARPLVLAADDHDRLVAVSSHLPQVLSVALGALLAAAGDADARVYDLCGPGIRSMLRLARSDAGLWGPIAQANSAALAQALRSSAAALDETAAALENGDRAALDAAFAQAHRAVAALERSSAAPRSSLESAPKR